jgi:hypothetical protein
MSALEDLERSRDLWGRVFDMAAERNDLAWMDLAMGHIRTLSRQIADTVTGDDPLSIPPGPVDDDEKWRAWRDGRGAA